MYGEHDSSRRASGDGGRDLTPTERLFKACFDDDGVACVAALEAGADPKVLDRRRVSALVIALGRPSKHCANILLERGGWQVPEEGRDQLLGAAIAAGGDWFEKVIAKGVRPISVDTLVANPHLKHGRSSLLAEALSQRQLDIAKRLLDLGASPIGTDRHDSPLYRLLTSHEPFPRLDMLLPYLAEEVKTESGQRRYREIRPLRAAGGEYAEHLPKVFAALRAVVPAELFAEAAPQDSPQAGPSPLALAVKAGDRPEVVRMLLDLGSTVTSDILLSCRDETTATMLVDSVRRAGTVEALPGDLLYAIKAGDTEAAFRTAFGVPSPDVATPLGLPALSLAIINGQLSAADFLLRAGADINRQDQHGNTPAHWAVQRKDHKGLNLLLERQADLSMRDKNGHTALELALMLGDQQAVKALAKAGSPEASAEALTWAEDHYGSDLLILYRRAADESEAKESSSSRPAPSARRAMRP